MKKLSPLFFLSLALACTAIAQDYKKFKLGLGGGYAGGTGAGSGNYALFGSGLLMTIEPAYRMNDNLAIGLRLETAAYGEANASSVPGGFTSITINGQYYFKAEKLKPFVGMGMGIYSGYTNRNAFGFYPRLGFDIGHFNMAIEYNFIPSGIVDNNNFNSTTTSSAQYIGVRIGGFFFGGKK